MTDLDRPAQFSAGDGKDVALVAAPQPVAKLIGRVVDQAGHAIQGAMVSIFRGVVDQKEAFSAESISAGPQNLVHKTTSDASGRFESAPIAKFKDRFQVAIEAPGLQPFRSHFLNGAVKRIEGEMLDIDEFRLLRNPQPVASKIRIVDPSEKPVADAEIALVGALLGRVAGRTDKDGAVELPLLNTPCLCAVRAAGFPILIKALSEVEAEMSIAIHPASADAQTRKLSWLTRDRQAYVALAKQLLDQAPVPKAKESSYYRQLRYFEALATADFDTLKRMLMSPNSEYQYRGQFAPMIADIAFRHASEELVAVLNWIRTMCCAPWQIRLEWQACAIRNFAAICWNPCSQVRCGIN